MRRRISRCMKCRFGMLAVVWRNRGTVESRPIPMKLTTLLYWMPMGVVSLRESRVSVWLTISLPPVISFKRISTRSLLVLPMVSSFQRSTPPSMTDAHRSHFGLDGSFFFARYGSLSTSELMLLDRFRTDWNIYLDLWWDVPVLRLRNWSDETDRRSAVQVPLSVQHTCTLLWHCENWLSIVPRLSGDLHGVVEEWQNLPSVPRLDCRLSVWWFDVLPRHNRVDIV